MELERELIELIIASCNLQEDVSAEEVGYDDPLFGPTSPVGLDSLDAVEIVFAIQKKYGVRIAEQDESRNALQSIRTLATLIRTESQAGP